MRRAPVTKPRHLAVLPALLLLAAAGAALAGEKVRLRYAFEPGATYDQAIKMELKIGMEAAGLPEEQAAMANVLMQDMTQQMSMRMAMVLGELDSEGSMPLEFRLEQMEASMVVAGQRMESPSPIADGASLMKGRITPTGRVLSMELAGAEGVDQEMMDQILRFIPEMPDVDLAPGETFEVPIRMAVPIPGVEMDLEGTSVYTLKGIAGSEASFAIAQSFALGTEGEGGAQIGGVSVSMNGGGSGTATFDTAQGIFSRVSVDMEITASIDGLDAGMAAGGGAGAGEEGSAAAGSEGAPAAPVKLKMKVSGPVEVTMVRRPVPR